MQSLVPQITTILLLLHLAVGCCVHHAHTCARQCGPVLLASAEGCCDQVAKRHATNPPPISHERPGRHRHQCEGDDCVFIATDTAPVLPGLDDSPPCWLQPSGIALGNRAYDLEASRSSTGIQRSAPLRAHLLFQVMLI